MRRDALDIGPAVHGTVPRVALVAVVGVAVLLLQPPLFWQAVAGIAAVVGGVLPRTMTGWLALAVVPLALVMQPVDLARTMIAVALIHAGHVLATLVLTVPARSRIALAALRPTALRFLGVQAIAQAVAVVAVILPTADGRGIPWAAPIGAVAVALVALLLIRRVMTRRHTVDSDPREQSFE